MSYFFSDSPLPSATSRRSGTPVRKKKAIAQKSKFFSKCIKQIFGSITPLSFVIFY